MGYFYLSDTLKNMTITPFPKTNGPILAEFYTLKMLMYSAAEVKVGIVHNNGKAYTPIRMALDKMGHKQGIDSLKKTTTQ